MGSLWDWFGCWVEFRESYGFYAHVVKRIVRELRCDYRLNLGKISCLGE